MYSIGKTVNIIVITLNDDSYQTYCDHIVRNINVKSLCCLPKTNIMLYVSYTLIKKRKGVEIKIHRLKKKKKEDPFKNHSEKASQWWQISVERWEEYQGQKVSSTSVKEDLKIVMELAENHYNQNVKGKNKK